MKNLKRTAAANVAAEKLGISYGNMVKVGKIAVLCKQITDVLVVQFHLIFYYFGIH